MYEPDELTIYIIAKGKLNNVIAGGLSRGLSLETMVETYRSSINVLLEMEATLEKTLKLVVPKDEAWRYLL